MVFFTVFYFTLFENSQLPAVFGSQYPCTHDERIIGSSKVAYG